MQSYQSPDHNAELPVPGSQCGPHPFPYEEAVGKGRSEGGLDLFGDHLGDGQSVVLAEVVEEAQGMVLDHHAVRGGGLLYLIHPALHYLTTALEAQVLVW